MSSKSTSFCDDLGAFVSSHKVLCVTTLGLPIPLYCIGRFCGRVVRGILPNGTTEKVVVVANNTRTEKGQSDEKETKEKTSLLTKIIEKLNWPSFYGNLEIKDAVLLHFLSLFADKKLSRNATGLVLSVVLRLVERPCHFNNTQTLANFRKKIQQHVELDKQTIDDLKLLEKLASNIFLMKKKVNEFSDKSSKNTKLAQKELALKAAQCLEQMVKYIFVVGSIREDTSLLIQVRSQASAVDKRLLTLMHAYNTRKKLLIDLLQSFFQSVGNRHLGNAQYAFSKMIIHVPQLHKHIQEMMTVVSKVVLEVSLKITKEQSQSIDQNTETFSLDDEPSIADNKSATAAFRVLFGTSPELKATFDQLDAVFKQAEEKEKEFNLIKDRLNTRFLEMNKTTMTGSQFTWRKLDVMDNPNLYKDLVFQNSGLDLTSKALICLGMFLERYRPIWLDMENIVPDLDRYWPEQVDRMQKQRLLQTLMEEEHKDEKDAKAHEAETKVSSSISATKLSSTVSQTQLVLSDVQQLGLLIKEMFRQQVFPSNLPKRFAHRAKISLRDCEFHAHIVLAGFSLLTKQIKAKKKQCYPVMLSLLRSSVIMAEQNLTAEVMVRCPNAMEHNPVGMAVELEFDQKHDQEMAHLQKMGEVTLHRFPHTYTRRYRRLETPECLLWLTRQKECSFNDLADFAINSIRFLEVRAGNSSHSLSKMMQAELKQALEASSTNQQDSKSTSSLELSKALSKITKLKISVEKEQKENQDKNQILSENLQNTLFHLTGLEEALTLWSNCSENKYLLLFVDLILMHLQHIDEELEIVLNIKKNGYCLQTHDLTALRQLREFEELFQKCVAEMNIGVFEHYPKLGEVSIPKPLPLALGGRLQAFEISKSGDAVDQGLTVTSSKRSKPTASLNDSKKLKQDLIKFVIDVMTMEEEKLRAKQD